MKMYKFFRSIIRTKKGQGFVEYALIITIVALAIVASLRSIIGPLERVFSSVTW